MPGVPVVPLAFALVSFAIAFNQIRVDPVNSAIGLAHGPGRAARVLVLGPPCQRPGPPLDRVLNDSPRSRFHAVNSESMTSRTLRTLGAAAVTTAYVAIAVASGQAQPAADQAAVDKIFARWTDATPGCAVGVSVDGQPALAKAYGMADLEHDVKNTPDTIFEAGSVSKQFTAAAVLLLAKEGKLSLDDPVRKYLPELPDYGAALDDPPHAQPHERSARLGERRRHRRLAAHDARLHARTRPRHRQPSARAELHARHAVFVQQHRLQPLRDSGRARQWHAVRRVQPEAALRTVGNDTHLVA